MYTRDDLKFAELWAFHPLILRGTGADFGAARGAKMNALPLLHMLLGNGGLDSLL